MSCNCGDGDEYIIELGEVGIQGIQGPKGDTGYSPVVTYTINNDTLKFTLINEESTTDTPNFYNYVAKRDLSNTSYNADMLVVNNNINNLSVRLTSEVNRLDIADSEIRTNLSNLSTATQDSITTINGDILSLQASYGALDRKVDSNMNTVTYRLDNRYTKSEVDNILLTYAQREDLKSVAFSGDYDDLTDKPTIGNGSITIRQGGSTKGTFNVNQTGNTVIELDQGGGSTYTEGTGIDITNDVISVDNTVAMKTDIPDVSNFVTNSSLATTLNNYVDLTSTQTISGVKSITSLNSNSIGVINNDGSLTAGRISYNSSADQLQITSLSNRDINVIPNGTGKFLYNLNEIATRNQIPDMTNYYTKTDTDTLLGAKQDALTASNGIDITNNIISCDNTIARASDIPTDYVKLTTDQTISGEKLFTDLIFKNDIRMYEPKDQYAQSIVTRWKYSNNDLRLSIGNTNYYKLYLNGSETRPKYGRPEGAEVNYTDLALYSDIPDITNYYTKTETDTLLDGKQDELTAGDGIDIETQTIDVVTGFTTNSSSITSDGYIAPSMTSNVKITTGSTLSYVAIPVDVSKKQLITTPAFNISNDGSDVLYGYFNGNGQFVPVLCVGEYYSSTNLFYANETPITTNMNNVEIASSTQCFAEGNRDVGDILSLEQWQIHLDGTTLYFSCGFKRLNAYFGGCYTFDLSDKLPAVEAIRKITTLIHVPHRSNLTVSLNDYGKYDLEDMLTSTATLYDTTGLTNLFDLNSSSYLAISCDNTIARVSDIPDVTTKLNTDGSNAANPITINNLTLNGYGTLSRSCDMSTTGTLQIRGSAVNIESGNFGINVEYNKVDLGNLSNGKHLTADTIVKYGTTSNQSEIATVDDIADKTSVYTVYDTEHFLITGNSNILNNILTINSGETGKITIPINTSLNSTIGLSYKIKMDPTAFGYIIDSPNYNILPCINTYQNLNSFDFWYPGKASSSGAFGSDWGTVEITLNKTTGACNFKLTDANDTVLVDTGFGYNNTQVADNTNWILDLNTRDETCTYKQIDLSTLTLTLDGVEYPCIPNNGKTTYSDLKVGDGLKVSRPKEYISWANPQMSSASQNGYVVTSNYNSSESGSANWKAFDKNTTTRENAWWTGMDATLPAWIQLEVPEAVIPTSCTIYNEVATPMNFKDGIIQGSNDGINYTDLYTITNRPDTTGYSEEYPIVTNTAYKYLRVYCTSNWYSGVSIQEIIWKGKIPNTGDLNPKLSLDLTTIQGYSPTGTLVLKCINGVMQWVAET